MEAKVEAKLSAKDDGLTKALAGVQVALGRLDDTVRKIGEILLLVKDRATPALQNAEKAAEKLENVNPTVKVEASDKATPVIEQTEQAVESLPEGNEVVLEAKDEITKPAEKAEEVIESIPEEHEVALEADNHVTKAADQASDSVNSIPEESMTALEAADHVTPAANQANDSVDSIPPAVNVALEAEDHVSSVCDEVCDKLEDVQEKAELTQAGLKGAFSFGAGSAVAQKAIGVVGSGLKELAVGSVEAGKSFESSMSNVASLMGQAKLDAAEGGKGFETLSNAAQKAGESTQFFASEAADALGYMALAGWGVDQSVGALPAVLDLAASSGMGLAEASDTVTDYLSAFSNSALTAAEMADIMSYAQANSNTSASQLGEAWKNCASSLNAAGQDVQTTTSFLEAMANQGLKGSEAGTAMAAVMRDITAKMENGAIKIGDTSVAVQDAKGNFLDLTTIMKGVESATAGMGDAQKAAALSATFTADSQKGVNMLLNEGMEKVEGYEKALRDCNGTASDMAKNMNDNLEGDLKSLNSAFEAVQVSIFQRITPALRSITQGATEVCRWINQLVSGWESWKAVMSGNSTKEQREQYVQLSESMKSIYRIIEQVETAWKQFTEGLKNSGAWEAITEAVGKVKEALFSFVGQLTGGSLSGMQTFGEVAGNEAKVIADVIGKIASFDKQTGGLVSKLALGAAGVKVLGSTFGKLGGVASSTMGRIKSLFSFKPKNPFKSVADDAGKSMKQAQSKIAQVIESIGSAVKGMGEGIAEIFRGIGDAIGSMNLMGAASFAVVIASVTAALVALSACRDMVLPFLQGLSDIFTSLVSGVLQALAEFFLRIASVVQIFADALVTLTPLVTAFGEAFALVAQAVGTGVATIITALTPIVEILSTTFVQIVQIISDAIVQIVGAIAPYMPEMTAMVQATAGAVDSICQAFSVLVSQVDPCLQRLREIIETVFSGLTTLLDQFGDTCKNVGEGIKTAFEGAGEVIESFGDAVSGILDSIAGIIDSIGNACLNAGTGFQALAEGVKTLTSLSLIDMAASLGAVAAGVAGIGAASSMLGDVGTQILSLATGMALLASNSQAVFQASMVATVAAQNLAGLADCAPGIETASNSIRAFGQSAGSISVPVTLASASLTGFVLSTAVAQAAFANLSGGSSQAVSAMRLIGSSTESSSRSMRALAKNTSVLSVAFAQTSAGVMEAMNQMSAAVLASITRMVALFKDFSAVLSRTGKQAGTDFANGLRTGLNGAIRVASSATASIYSALSSINTFYIGQMIGQGLVNGMRSKLAEVEAVARQLGSTAEEATRRATQVRSPSRVFRKIGEYIGEGLTLGIESARPDVMKAANEIVAVPEVAQMDYLDEGRSSKDASSGNVTIHFHQEMNGREVAKGTATFMRAELDRLDRLDIQLKGG